MVSVLVRPTVGARDVHVFTMAAAVALRSAVEEVAGVRSDVKWPNDLVVRDRKLAGVLAEADMSAAGDVGAVVIGVGCNVQWTDFPSDIAAAATACNVEAGRDIAVADVLIAFLDHLSDLLDDLSSVPERYRDALATLDQRVRVDLGTRVIEGIATSVDEIGRLHVTRADGQEELVAVGDVVHLR